MTETHDYQPATGSQVTLPGAAPRAAFLGQSTSIEQTRAVAEVEALVIVAQRRPRDEITALNKIRRSAKILSLADKAFYDYNRGSTQVRDLSIKAVKEAARCWGNLQFAVVELSQDLANNQSEMLAWAWDMEANIRVERRKIVPHVRDVTDKKTKVKSRKVITDFREIGEILGNWAARQLRECIKDVLPPFYLDEIRDAFTETLNNKIKEKPFEVSLANAIEEFGKFDVSKEQLEINLDRPSSKWTVHDLTRLRVKIMAIRRGELRVEDEFPPVSLKAADAEHVAPDTATAASIAAMVKPAPQPEPATDDATALDDVTDEMLTDLLSLVDVIPSELQLAEWTPEQRVQVAQWAGAVHLDASDNLDVQVPDRPSFLPDPSYVCDVCGAVGSHYQDDHATPAGKTTDDPAG